MNTIDIIIGLILIIAFFVGFSKGLLRSLASLIGIVVGVYCAMFFSDYVGRYLVRWFDWSADTTNVVAFVVTFLLIMILFSILGRLLTKVADFAMLGIFNKLFGGVFNVLKLAFLISVVFMFVNASEEYEILTPEQRQDSKLYGPVAMIAPAILPTIMKEVGDYNLGDEEILEEKSPAETELESENE
ncbi:CvpA family protein [Aequorivita sp. SDUM287046]|uniref:CvpA family protein n=1 Tax=Aequorivita aurantiaca TaxID=3053356 RepID=A0ABT8DDC3_9FLAO|nr:CvpA family protein [Aequorivita aurantiaca]MDN3723033.1 CvpA family protein [Aequorivita aurantiaca]